MKWGMYRLVLPERGECARVHWLAGDAAPYLERALYEAAGFEPSFEELPSNDAYRRHHPWMHDRYLPMVEDAAVTKVS